MEAGQALNICLLIFISILSTITTSWFIHRRFKFPILQRKPWIVAVECFLTWFAGAVIIFPRTFADFFTTPTTQETAEGYLPYGCGVHATLLIISLYPLVSTCLLRAFLLFWWQFCLNLTMSLSVSDLKKLEHAAGPLNDKKFNMLANPDRIQRNYHASKSKDAASVEDNDGDEPPILLASDESAYLRDDENADVAPVAQKDEKAEEVFKFSCEEDDEQAGSSKFVKFVLAHKQQLKTPFWSMVAFILNTIAMIGPFFHVYFQSDATFYTPIVSTYCNSVLIIVACWGASYLAFTLAVILMFSVLVTGKVHENFRLVTEFKALLIVGLYVLFGYCLLGIKFFRTLTNR
eukprot:TRINITY_DN8319_c0_g1_i4.p1 TRINITY_DN8319_c0_g1~~TRINITY_DN8319_c0_g1_i4.p1  ORF type:complete len:389 (-),score=63.05 TRINITY_DN8319_c0_g1_i4:357-1400(-)